MSSSTQPRQPANRSCRRLALALPLTGLLWLAVAAALPTSSSASIGVGVQGVPVSLATVAHPGATYKLPQVYVVNTGTQPEVISVKVERLSPGQGRLVPPSWVRTTGPAAHLSPHQSGRLALDLVVPSGAASGRYLSDIVVDGSAAIAVGRANLGVAAATKLEFSVVPGSGPALVPPWVWGTLGGALLLLVATVAVKRSGLRIRVERTPGTLSHSSRPAGRIVSGGQTVSGRAVARGAVFCGTIVALAVAGVPNALAGTNPASGTTTASLSVVPSVVALKVTPGTSSFSSCSAGAGSTASTPTAMGFPNGTCAVGFPGETYPITIRNTGMAADVDINGDNSVPSNGSTGWALCSFGAGGGCTGGSDEPGLNQYLMEEFASGGSNSGDVHDTPSCDITFDLPTQQGCAASSGQAQHEGITIVGPSSSTNTSTAWTVAITWTAVAA